MDSIFGEEKFADVLPQAWTVEKVFENIRAFSFPQMTEIDSLEIVGFFWFTGPYLDYLYYNAPKLLGRIFSATINQEYYDSLNVDSPPPWFCKASFKPDLEVSQALFELISACISHDLFGLVRVINCNSELEGCTAETMVVWDYNLHENEPVAKRVCTQLFKEEESPNFTAPEVTIVENKTKIFSLPPRVLEKVQEGDPQYKWCKREEIERKREDLERRRRELADGSVPPGIVTSDSDSLLTSDESQEVVLYRTPEELRSERVEEEKKELERRLRISKLENTRDKLQFEMQSRLLMNDYEGDALMRASRAEQQVKLFQDEIMKLLKEDEEASFQRELRRQRVLNEYSDDEETLLAIKEKKENNSVSESESQEEETNSESGSDTDNEETERLREAERVKEKEKEKEKERELQAQKKIEEEKARQLAKDEEDRAAHVAAIKALELKRQERLEKEKEAKAQKARELQAAADAAKKSAPAPKSDIEILKEMMTKQMRIIAELSLQVEGLARSVEELSLKDDCVTIENYLDGMHPRAADLFKRIRKYYPTIPIQGLTTPQCVLLIIHQDYPDCVEELLEMGPDDFVLAVEAKWNTSALRQISQSNNFDREIVDLPRVNIVESLERKLHNIITDHPQLKKLMEQLTNTGAQLNLIHKVNASNIIPDRPGAFGVAPPRQENEDYLLGYGNSDTPAKVTGGESVKVTTYAKEPAQPVVSLANYSSDEDIVQVPAQVPIPPSTEKAGCMIWQSWEDSPAAKEAKLKSGLKLAATEPSKKKVTTVKTQSLFIYSSDEEN